MCYVWYASRSGVWLKLIDFRLIGWAPGNEGNKIFDLPIFSALRRECLKCEDWRLKAVPKNRHFATWLPLLPNVGLAQTRFAETFEAIRKLPSKMENERRESKAGQGYHYLSANHKKILLFTDSACLPSGKAFSGNAHVVVHIWTDLWATHHNGIANFKWERLN